MGKPLDPTVNYDFDDVQMGEGSLTYDSSSKYLLGAQYVYWTNKHDF